MCEDLVEVNKAGSLYFIGYGVGAVFFFLPDTLGRKGTMKMILPLYILCCYLSLFPMNMEVRTLGFFLQGLFHLKISTSYTHILELVPED